MKRGCKKLALLAMAACLVLGIGEVRKSCAFAGSAAWVAGVDSQTGLLPVFAQPSDDSVTVGSLHRCTKVTLTGNEQDSWVEISIPMMGWVPSSLLTLNASVCSRRSAPIVYDPPEEVTHIVSGPPSVLFRPRMPIGPPPVSLGLMFPPPPGPPPGGGGNNPPGGGGNNPPGGGGNNPPGGGGNNPPGGGGNNPPGGGGKSIKDINNPGFLLPGAIDKVNPNTAWVKASPAPGDKAKFSATQGGKPKSDILPKKAQDSATQGAKTKFDTLPGKKAQDSATQGAKTKFDANKGKAPAIGKTFGTQSVGQINKTSFKTGSNVTSLSQKSLTSSLKSTGGYSKPQTTRVAGPNFARPSSQGMATSPNSSSNWRRR